MSTDPAPNDSQNTLPVSSGSGAQSPGIFATFASQSLPVRVLIILLGSIVTVGALAGAGYGVGRIMAISGGDAPHSVANLAQSQPDAAQSRSSDADTAASASSIAVPQMNPTEIAQGNYRSVAGQWVNTVGHVMTVEEDSFTFLHEGAPNFQVVGLEIPGGKPHHSFAPAIVTTHPGDVVQLQWVDEQNGFPFENGALFFPEGSEVEYWKQAAVSDVSRERILAVGAGYASGRDLPKDLTPFIFYRVPTGKNSADVADELAQWRDQFASGQAASCAAPVPGAYACAGGVAPEGAIELSSAGVTGVGALVRTPSGNIRCGISGRQHPNGYGYLRCYVKSWAEEGRFTPESNGGPDGGIPHVAFDSEVPVYKQLGTAPGEYMFEGDNDVTTEMAYGHIYTYGPFACASEETGLTCWNVETGHGAFMNKREFLTF